MLRPATSSDAQLLFDWANESETRSMSINTAAIRWEDHLPWFERKIADPATKLFILEDENNEVGQIRLELRNEEWLIGYSIAAPFRGKGYGHKIVSLAIDAVDNGRFVAFVKPENTASIKIFASLGFSDAGNVIQDGTTLLKFTLDKK